MQYDADHKPPRPRSLMILPTPKLISLEEAQARSRGGLPAPTSDSLNSSSETGVRLRESGDKQSSADRRKRHTKKTNQAFIHSSTPKVLRKHGSSQANLHQSDQSTTDSHSTGWKVKLGSLLRKSNAHSSMLNQSSLRRTQSDDSLVSSGSQQKISETATRGKKTLSHASSCEEGGFCDRLFPEPQVPHPNVPTSNPSPVPMRNRPADNRPHPNNTRPTGVYSDEPTDTKNIFEV
uniref:Uncharacterized protein n=1 Tax=Ciona savignyi TaxID=51511 RepID=H2Z1L3_CIOSA